MTDQASEKSISQAIVKYLRAQPGCWAHKIHGSPYGSIGEPDIDAVLDGHSIRLEVKRPGPESTVTRNVTPHQRTSMRRWSSVGATVGVVCSVEEAAALLGLPCPKDTNGDGDCGRALCPCMDREALVARVGARVQGPASA